MTIYITEYLVNKNGGIMLSQVKGLLPIYLYVSKQPNYVIKISFNDCSLKYISNNNNFNTCVLTHRHGRHFITIM